MGWIREDRELTVRSLNSLYHCIFMYVRIGLYELKEKVKATTLETWIRTLIHDEHQDTVLHRIDSLTSPKVLRIIYNSQRGSNSVSKWKILVTRQSTEARFNSNRISVLREVGKNCFVALLIDTYINVYQYEYQEALLKTLYYKNTKSMD